MKKLILTGVISAILPTFALADCPAITVEDMQGISAGAYPNQFELAELQDAASCEMGFSENPSIAAFYTPCTTWAYVPLAPIVKVPELSVKFSVNIILMVTVPPMKPWC